MKALLDDLPLGTLTAMGGGILALIGYVNGDISIFDALSAWGIVSAGGGGIGVARNQAGRGLKK